jgi:probable HAF family extracellular repeat protein
MRYRMRDFRRSTTAGRALVVTMLTLSVVPACDRDDPLPISPLQTAPAPPVAAVLGTVVAGGTSSWAYGLHQSRQVVASTTISGSRHAFLWTPGQGLRDLPGGANHAASQPNPPTRHPT